MSGYAHMCRADHIEIGHNDSEHEHCPLCILLAACDAVLESETCHDERGHAYLKVPARSVYDPAMVMHLAVKIARGEA